MSFGQLIKSFRADNGLSQDEFAHFLSSKTNGQFDVGTISRWERQTNSPSLTNQFYFLRKMGVKFSAGQLLDFKSGKSNNEALELLLRRYNRFAGLSDKPYRAEFTQFTYTDSTELECLLQDEQLRDFDLKFNGLDFYNKIPQFVNEVELFGARILKLCVYIIV
ncbi:helix-turn-helix domain-containing protein [Shewanella xiamenensis]|uniref:XRE family transcriptional regulator n=1 Tax=Shewanella decolorationis TaxID=256839 RepID=A0A5B8R2C4_9GAMM|nr:helix-turn-helix transcriptional regulator [Shewanella xiamenensis]